MASISNTKFFENTLIAVNYSLFSKRTRVYRYGFNGKEQDDEVHSSAGTSYDYGERIYDPRIGRFLSVDPFFAKYPELSTYQFASNRPIDGVDLDGLEYATFHIFIQDGTVRNIRTTTDYELKSKTSKGPGVQYNYIYLDKKGKVENVSISMDVNRHGIYQGENNPRLPTVGSRSSELHDDYSLKPIDEADANAKIHDLDYSAVGAEGLGGVLDKKTITADEHYIKRAKIIIDKFSNGEKDAVTGKPITKEANSAAKKGFLFFKATAPLKSDKPDKQPENKAMDNGHKE